MCGRFALDISRAELILSFGLEECPEVALRYNISPFQEVLAIRQRSSGERVAHPLRWGLIPSWTKDLATVPKLINARAESVAQKPSYRSAYKSRRCIVPASGFYEWKKEAGGKQAYYIRLVQEGPLALAGVWERWTPTEGESIDSFAILTTEANEAMQAIHDRMPVLLGPENYGLWLTKESDPTEVAALLRPCDPALLQVYRVSQRVGNVRNDDAGLISEI